MPDHTYTVSRDELERLRRQIGDLKAQPAELRHTATLIDSMDRLHESLSRLIVIFESANRDMAQEAAQGIHDEHQKLDKLLDQNEKIARAVVQLADIVKQQRSDAQLVRAEPVLAPPQPTQQSMPQQSFLPPEPAMPAFTPVMQNAPPVPAAPRMNMLPPLPTPAPPRPSLGSLPPLRSPAPLAPTQTLPPAPPYPGQQAAMPQLSPPSIPRAPLPPPRLPALGEQNSFVNQPVATVRQPLTPDIASSMPPPPPPPSTGQKRGVLNRFSFQ